MENISGIYAITSPSGNQYIGSSQNVARRWTVHKSQLRRGVHHCRPLQAACDKYGLKSLSFTILLECQVEDLLRQERLAFDRHTPKYNTAKDPLAPMRGRKQTEEAKRKMSKPGALNPNFGKSMSAEKRKVMDRTGTTHTPETRAAYSARMLGRNNPFYGKTHTAETRARISAAASTRVYSEERKAKVSVATAGERNPNFGKTHSPETRAKISASRQAGNAARKAARDVGP